jgi:tetratricopeptide (TPR) repeat protein
MSKEGDETITANCGDPFYNRVFNPMSRGSKKKAGPENPPAVRSSTPVSPAGEMPGVADSPTLKTAITQSNPNGRLFGNRDWICALLLVVVTVLAYQPAWNGKPIWDDDAHITKPELRSLGGLARIWIEPGASQQYYPLVHSFFWVEHRLWGDRTLGYHLINILLHACCVLLLVKILRRMDVPGGWLAAAIFALHPVEVETVAWITELKNTLSGVCCLGAALVYLNFDRDRKWTFYAGALSLFILGLMSKTVIATLPAALLVVFWWKRGRLSWKKEVLPLLPFFAVGIAAGLFTAWMERVFIGAEGSEFDFSAIERCLIAGRAFWFYLGKLFWPANLVFIYPRWNVSQAVWWQYLFPAAALLLLVGLWLWRRRSRGPLAGLLFFAGTLFPALGFFNVYPFRFSFVADHFQYLAGIGPIVLATAGMTTAFGFLERRKPFLKPVLCGVLLVPLCILTWQQCGMYADVETLWQTTIRLNPNCWMAYNHLGNALLQKGNVDEAIAQFQKTLQIKPDYAVAHYNLGNALLQKGNVDDAIAHYQKALQIKPDYAEACYNLGNALLQKGNVDDAIAHYQKALQIKPDYAKAHNNLGSALLQKGNVDEAIAHFQKALRIIPDFAGAHYNLGTALLQKDNVDEAIAHFQMVLQIKPDFAEAHYNLGNALLKMGKVDEAISHFQKALQIIPDYAKAHNNLGTALLQKGKVDEAISHFQKALQIIPDYAKAHNNLGNALLQKGKVDEAISHYQKALQINPDYAEAQNNLAWVLATCPQASLRNGNKAVELALRANQLAGDGNPAVLGTLAAAYAEAGRFPEAVATAQRALQLAGTQSNTGLADVLRSQMKLYQAGLPFHLH